MQIVTQQKYYEDVLQGRFQQQTKYRQRSQKTLQGNEPRRQDRMLR